MTASLRKKKAQMPEFNWLFAIIVGAVILFLAIYFAGKLIRTGGYKESVVLLRNLDILLNPFASLGAVGEALSKPIKMPAEAIVEFSCDSTGLGEEGLRLKSKGSFGKWSEFAPDEGYYYVYDKYVFAETLKGKNFYLLSKPFALPFRIDDLIYITAEDYCFVNAPDAIEEELSSMNIPAIEFKNSTRECKETSKTVCFETEGCDIKVEGALCEEDEECEPVYKYGNVNKDNKILPFVTDALMYGAIFASSGIYECNFERLMNRLTLLCDIYNERVDKLSGRGCDMEDVNSLIGSLRHESTEAREASDMSSLYALAQNLADKNYYLGCPLF